jgi:hypothetical protein
MKKLLTLLMFLSISLYADPSMQETIDFIKEKTDMKWTNNDSGKINQTQHIEIKSCKMNLITVWFNNDRSPKSQYKIVTPLSEIDPSRIQTEIDKWDNRIVYYIKKQRPAIKQYYLKNGSYLACGDNTGCMNDMDRGWINVFRPYQINAEKLVKALRHITKLCGGKGELF